MDDNKFWLGLWAVGATVIIALIISITAAGYDRRATWEKAVMNGADPMAAACALYNQSPTDAVICALLVQNRK